jgi:hypothetical protein
MENNQQSFTAEESLQLISKTIAGLKSTHKKNNYYFLLWGWIVTLACISHFIVLRILLTNKLYDRIALYSWLTWGIFVMVGLVIQYIHIYKLRSQTTVKSHLEKFMTILWQTSGAAMIITAFISYNLHTYPGPLVFIIAGMSTLVTGLQIKFRPLIFGGIILFAGAIVSSYVMNEYQLLINAGAIAAGYLIPGYMLKISKD